MSTRQNHLSAPPRATLRRLAKVQSDEDVLSVFLDLDPSVFPTPADRESEITALVREAEDVFKDAGTIERLRDALNDSDIVKGGARAVAIFAAPAEDVFEIVGLDAPIAPAVVVDSHPYLRPLVDESGPRTWLVLLTDRRNARVMYGGPRRLVEVASFADNIRSRPKGFGGWSQANYQRHHDEVSREHLDRAIDVVSDFLETVPFEALAIAAPDPVYDDVVKRLPAPLAERLQGRVHVEIDFPSPAAVLDAAAPVFDEARTRALNDILDSLEDRNRDLVSIGTEDVLQALHERRVMTLVVAEQFDAKGFRCPQCSWVGLRGDLCPYDRTPTEPSGDIADDAIDMALGQAARVVQIAADADRQPPEPLSALLRF